MRLLCAGQNAQMDLLALEAKMKWRNLLASICMFVCGAMLFAADKSPAPLSKTYDAPIERVYAAVVQVASANYNLKSAVKEGHTVSFFSGGQFSLVLSAICREAGTDKTSVSISIAQAVGNPQIFGVGKAKDKEALRFWTELDKAIQINQGLTPDSNKSKGSATKDESAQVTVKSTPDGADITLDGKFVGSTPSSFQVTSGDHSIRVELSGFVPWEKSLTITPGGQITLNANLQRKSSDAPQ
jgi:hypothetical protein